MMRWQSNKTMQNLGLPGGARMGFCQGSTGGISQRTGRVSKSWVCCERTGLGVSEGAFCVEFFIKFLD